MNRIHTILLPFCLFAASIFMTVACDTTDPPLIKNWGNAEPLLFVSNKSGTMQLYSMDIDGTNVKQLTEDAEFSVNHAKWSPDKMKIVFTSFDSDTYRFGSTIYIAEADGSNMYKIAYNAVDGLHYGTGEKPEWSPDSKSIIFSRLMFHEAVGNTDIYTINIDGSNERRITHTAGLEESWTSFSCDGQRTLSQVVHWSTTDKKGRSIKHITTTIHDLEGQIIKEFGVEGEGWTTPIWSKDCKTIVFTLWDEFNGQDLYSMNTNGSDFTKLTNGNYKYLRPVVWTQTDKIIFNAGNDIYLDKILVMDTNGENKIEITPFDAEILEATSYK